MVSAAWLLLGFACKATDLGVILPEKGVKAISQEDIKRDLWLHAQADGDWQWYRQRMSQMGLKAYPSSKGMCFGQKDSFTLVGCDDAALGGALNSAALISLAKSMHHNNRSVAICYYPSCSDIQSYDLWIQDISGELLHIVDRKVFTTETVSVPSDLNYLRVRNHLQRLTKELPGFE